MKKKMFLRFPRDKVMNPVAYRLVKDFGLIINIFSARITAEDGGHMGIEVEGKEETIKEAIAYLKKSGVDVDDLEKHIKIDAKKCTDCGACVSVCPASAFSADKQLKINLETDKCIACGQCVDACPFRALSMV